MCSAIKEVQLIDERPTHSHQGVPSPAVHDHTITPADERATALKNGATAQIQEDSFLQQPEVSERRQVEPRNPIVFDETQTEDLIFHRKLLRRRHVRKLQKRKLDNRSGPPFFGKVADTKLKKNLASVDNTVNMRDGKRLALQSTSSLIGETDELVGPCSTLAIMENRYGIPIESAPLKRRRMEIAN